MIARLLFALFVTIIVVFFSEKAFYYVQGYTYFLLILFYLMPVYACLWAIQHFHVRRISAVIVVAALYAFLVEGVITPIIYEVGYFDVVMPMYFVGWHGMISFVLGWYFLARWMVNQQWGRILLFGIGFGIFWGLWSVTFWLPENYEEWVKPGIWPIEEYAMYAFVFTATLITGHFLIARWMRLQSFALSRYEKGIVLVSLIVLFTLIVASVLPFAIFKLAVLLGIVFFVLERNRKQESEGAIYTDLSVRVSGIPALALMVMPITAIIVYAIADMSAMSEAVIRSWLADTIPLFQSLIGAIVFIWAIIDIIGFKKRQLSEVA